VLPLRATEMDDELRVIESASNIRMNPTGGPIRSWPFQWRALGRPRVIRIVRRIMGFLLRVRQHNTVRVYSGMRRALTGLAVGFVVAGAMGLLGFGETRSSGQLIEGPERVIVQLLFVGLGVGLGLLRIIVFRHRRVSA